MISSEEIGRKLRDLRKSKKITTTELANKINVSQSYISQFALGNAVPNIIMLQRILHALGTDCHFERYFAHILNTILHEMKYKNLSSCKR